MHKTLWGVSLSLLTAPKGSTTSLSMGAYGCLRPDKHPHRSIRHETTQTTPLTPSSARSSFIRCLISGHITGTISSTLQRKLRDKPACNLVWQTQTPQDRWTKMKNQSPAHPLLVWSGVFRHLFCNSLSPSLPSRLFCLKASCTGNMHGLLKGKAVPQRVLKANWFRSNAVCRVGMVAQILLEDVTETSSSCCLFFY